MSVKKKEDIEISINWIFKMKGHTLQSLYITIIYTVLVKSTDC